MKSISLLTRPPGLELLGWYAGDLYRAYYHRILWCKDLCMAFSQVLAILFIYQLASGVDVTDAVPLFFLFGTAIEAGAGVAFLISCREMFRAVEHSAVHNIPFIQRTVMEDMKRSLSRAWVAFSAAALVAALLVGFTFYWSECCRLNVAFPLLIGFYILLILPAKGVLVIVASVLADKVPTRPKAAVPVVVS